MERYDSYKDSGVEWIGKIPSHWEVCKVKHSYKLQTGFTPASGQKKYYCEEDDGHVWITIGDISGKYVSKSSKHITNKAIEDYLPEITPKGSLLFSFKLSVGQVAFNSEDCYTNEAIASFLTDSKGNLDYFYYASQYFIEFNSNTNIYGAHILNQNLINNAYITMPPADEQIKIAKYLDRKCEEIDKAIATQEKRVELLKELRQNIITQAVTRGINPNAPLKDSGVEWIGEVPEHWEMKRIKHVCKINGRVGYRGYTTADLVPEGEGAYTIGGKHISNNVLDLTDAEYISWDKYYESPEIMVKKGDIVTAQRGSLGKTAIIRDEIGEATINPSLVLLNHISIYNEFLYWYLVSTPTLIAIELLNTSTAVPMVSQWQISNINIPVPPLSEQQEIVSYIETQTARLDKSIEKAEHQIELLQELKQSIITEVVTGKRKVC